MTIRGCLAVALFLLTTPLWAATFTVTSSNSSGAGTLEQTILDANANPGRDAIVFAVAFVNAETSLPAVTDPIDLDGTFGSRDITLGGPAIEGLPRFTFGTGSNGSTLRDVEFSPAVPAIRILSGVSGILIAGNRITGRIEVRGDSNTIGGTAPEDRNFGNFGISVNGADNLVVGNALLNVTVTGPAAVGNRIGTLAVGNTIQSVLSNASGTLIVGNSIAGGFTIPIDVRGLTAANAPLVESNSITGGLIGIHVRAPGAVIRSNVITGSSGAGIQVNPDITGVTITANSITGTGIPIDLGVDGATANDAAPDADAGANSLQNFPVLTAASLTPGTLAVAGSLASAPLTSYDIEIFASPAATPQAATFLGTFTVTTDATGNVIFEESLPAGTTAGDDVITATATSRAVVAIPGNTPNSTSELSAPLAVAEPGVLSFSPATYTLLESDGTVTLTVTRTSGSEGVVTVSYATVPGSATAPLDFTSTSGTLTFDAGVVTQTITVPITVDAVREPAESFTVTLTTPTGGASIGTATATVTITEPAVAAAPIPTASEWGLLLLAAALATIVLVRLRTM